MKTKEQEQLVQRINFCARTLKAFGAGQLIVDANTPLLRYEVNDCGKIRIYRTLEELEAFTERLITNRYRPSDTSEMTRSTRRGMRRSRIHAAWVA